MAFPGVRLSIEQLRRERAKRAGDSINAGWAQALGGVDSLQKNMLALADRRRREEMDKIAAVDRERSREREDVMFNSLARKDALEEVAPFIQAEAYGMNRLNAENQALFDANRKLDEQRAARGNVYEQKMAVGHGAEPIPENAPLKTYDVDAVARRLAEQSGGVLTPDAIKARMMVAERETAMRDEDRASLQALRRINAETGMMNAYTSRDRANAYLADVGLRNEVLQGQARKASAAPTRLSEQTGNVSTSLREAARSGRRFKQWADKAQNDVVGRTISAIPGVSGTTGALATPVREAAASLVDFDPEGVEVRQGLVRNLNAVIKATSGAAVSKSEEGRLFAQEATTKDPPQKLLTKLAETARYLRGQYRNDLAAAVSAGELTQERADQMYREVAKAPMFDEDPRAYMRRLMGDLGVSADEAAALAEQSFDEVQ